MEQRDPSKRPDVPDWMRNPPEESMLERYIAPITLGVFAFLIGGLLLYYWRVNNSDSTLALRADVMNPNLLQLQAIEIHPIRQTSSKPNKQRPTLVREVQTITDRSALSELAAALKTAGTSSEESGESSNTQWNAQIKHVYTGKTVTYVVHNYGKTTIQLWSDGDQGWNLGTYSCPALAPVLERLTGWKTDE